MAGRITLNGFMLPVYSALKTTMGHTYLCVPLYFKPGIYPLLLLFPFFLGFRKRSATFFG